MCILSGETVISMKLVTHERLSTMSLNFSPDPKALESPEDLHEGCWTHAEEISEPLVLLQLHYYY